MRRFTQLLKLLLLFALFLLSMGSEYLDSIDLEKLTGTRSSTWRFWAVADPPQGPPSFKLGRRRVWKRSDVMAWLAEQETAVEA